MAGRTAHEELHHALCLRRDHLRTARIFRGMEGSKGQGAESLSGGSEKLAAREHHEFFAE